jgi:hypothetical protein
MRRIPAKVVKALELKSDQMWRSLWTENLEEAIKALPAKLREFDELIVSVQPKKDKFGGRNVPVKPRAEGTTKYLLEEHIPSILSRYEFGILDTDDELRKVMTREDRAEYREMLVEGLQGLYDMAAAEDYATMGEIAEQLLSIERLIAPPGTMAHQQLLKQLLQIDIELMETQVGRLSGKMKPTPKHLPIAPRDLPTLLDPVKDWSRKQNEIRTIETYSTNVAEFEALNGALPVIAITREQAKGYREQLKDAGLSRATVKNRLGGLSTLVRHGFKKDLLSSMQNPFDNIDLWTSPASVDTC